MTNKEEAYKFWESLAHSDNVTQETVKFGCKDNFIEYDAACILDFANIHTNMLDIGSGTGLIVNQLVDKVNSIDCVEPFPELSKFIKKKDNVQVINKNIFDFEPEKKYDLITMFGFITYFSELEARQIYKKAFSCLYTGGGIIVKNQFGLEDDVIVSGYSEELGRNYYCAYRKVSKEISILEEIGFKNIKMIDIYPKEGNRWSNTHFYALIGNK